MTRGVTEMMGSFLRHVCTKEKKIYKNKGEERKGYELEQEQNEVE